MYLIAHYRLGSKLHTKFISSKNQVSTSQNQGEVKHQVDGQEVMLQGQVGR